jgi:hypothetical protein
MNTRFQAVVTIVFIVLAVVGVIAFATLKSNSAESKIITAVWGTIPSNTFSQFLSTINQTRGNSPLKIAYTAKEEVTFEKELVDALARGEGPDAVVISQDFISRQKDKLYPITFSIYPERTFKDTFVEAGEVFL